VLKAKHKLTGNEPPSVWHPHAHRLIERSMLEIATLASKDNGQIDASQLDNASCELLQLYLEHQETWQEVCLVVQHDPNHKTSRGTTSTATLVLNRPMALKLTENLARLVLYGAQSIIGTRSGTTATRSVSKKTDPRLLRFLEAFGSECAVYIGGPDDQDGPAEILHGIRDLDGSVEVSPHTGIYVGGVDAAIDGVLQGKFKPMDFRFFVGRHHYEHRSSSRSSVGSSLWNDLDEDDSINNSNNNEDEAVLPLHAQVLLGKYQPIACSRSLVLKQCISLPKPLWFEVMDIAGTDRNENRAFVLLVAIF
jgi:hypothetical protein